VKRKKGKTKMGRPRKKREQLRSAVVNVRMTKAEREVLEEEAQKAGVTLSEVFMRPWRKE